MASEEEFRSQKSGVRIYYETQILSLKKISEKSLDLQVRIRYLVNLSKGFLRD
ncbi:MAG: hypothetical protein AB1611_08640 [bacterium]